MGAGSGKGGGGAGGIPPVLPNQPTSGKGGSNGIPPAQPNQPTLGNQLNPQPSAMGKGGAMSLDYDRRPPPAFAQQMQQPAMGKGGAMPQQPRGTMGTTQADYDRFMATAKFAPGASIPTYEEWSASRVQQMPMREGSRGLFPRPTGSAYEGKPAPTFAQPTPQRDVGTGGGKGSAQQIAQQIPPQIAQQLVQAIQGGKGGSRPLDYDRRPPMVLNEPRYIDTGTINSQAPVVPPMDRGTGTTDGGILNLPNIPRGSARPRYRRLMSPAPRRRFRPLTRRSGRTR